MEGRRTSGRAVPRPVLHGTIGRPRLQSLLDDGARRRLVTLVADAGFGKSTLLTSWAANRQCAWYTARAQDRTVAAVLTGLFGALEARLPGIADGRAEPGPGAGTDPAAQAASYAGLLAESVEQRLEGELVLVVDDLHELPDDAPGLRLIDALVRVAPAGMHVVLASRTPVPFAIDRLRGRGQVLELDGQSLAFTVQETAELLQVVLGDGTEELAEPLHDAVRGWPAAARLAAESLRSVPASQRRERLDRTVRADGPLYDYLAEEVFAAAPDAVRRLVAAVAVLPRFDAELCAALGLPSVDDTLAVLTTRGLLVPAEENGYQLHPLVRDFALARLAPDPAERAERARAAAGWFRSRGECREALACHLAAGDAEGAAEVLRLHGEDLIAGGEAATVAAAVTSLPAELRDRTLDQVEGEALQVLGDADGAMECFARVAGDSGELSAGIAWRLGLMYHLRGYLDRAVSTYQRGRIDGSNPHDEAMLQGWWASVHWMRGEIDDCRRLAGAAMAVAREAGDDRGLAIAHTALGMLASVDSDPRATLAHYRRALDHAQRAGDLLQTVRVLVNRSSHYVDEAQYAEAITQLDEAIRLADLSGYTVYRALAMNNRGEALLRLGRLDEAIRELEGSRALYASLDSRRVAQPLAVLGEVYRYRGDLAMAQACYEESIAMAADDRDTQSLVPSLAGLARVLVKDEPDRAAELIEMAKEAVSYGPVISHPAALLGVGWVSLHGGDLQTANQAADEAAALCRRRRDRAGLANALELKVAAAGQRPAEVTAEYTPNPVDQALRDALAIRQEIGDVLGEGRVQLMMARRATGREVHEYARAAHERFLAVGATRYAAAAQALDERTGPAAIEIGCLGGFRVLRAGEPVRLGEWPSRKARDLLKILVAKRCHPVPRTVLLDLLWPDEDESAVSGRLSVALSTVRSVLDPGKQYDADRFVGADRATIWLDAATAAVDVELFLRDARAGLDAVEAGRVSQSVLLLRAAEASYKGDFCEEDVYADWAGPLRDEARALYVRVARALADHAAGSGDHDAAAGYLLRILQRDSYDERAHLALVGAHVAGGAHGEARRSYRTYLERMEELGVEPAPFPTVGRRALRLP